MSNTLKMKDKVLEAKTKLMEVINSENINAEAYAQAQEDYMNAVAETAMEQVKSEYEDYLASVNGDVILAKRGTNVLTAEEKRFYNEVTKAGGFKADVIMPETVIERVFEDLKEDRPLLRKIKFSVTTSKRTTIRGKRKGIAVFGPLHKDLEGELDTEFDVEEMGQLALTAFIVLSNDSLDIGPSWIDRYVRICLSEAIAEALEKHIIVGTGKDQPIGLLKDLKGGTNGSGELNDKASSGTLTLADSKTMVKEFSQMFKDLTKFKKYIGSNDTVGEDKFRKVGGKVILIVNPINYYDIVARATVQTDSGTFVTNLPFIGSENIIESLYVPEGKVIAFVDGEYDATVSRPQKIYAYKETFALQRATLYAVDMLSNGKPMNNDACKIYDLDLKQTVVVP